METGKRKRGRPEHEPDRKSRKVVSELVTAGIDQDTIAKALGIAPSTLRKHYRTEIDVAADLAISKLAGALYRRALGMADGPAVTAAIFWLKTRAGWSDRPVAPAAGAPPLATDAVDVWGGEDGA